MKKSQAADGKKILLVRLTPNSLMGNPRHHFVVEHNGKACTNFYAHALLTLKKSAEQWQPDSRS